jgi:glyoxylase-like metal-dependent hydrolase (beta-lactamase superfamily II)
MQKEVFPFKIGDFECMVIHDAEFRLPHTGPDDVMQIQALFVRTGKNTILLDSGWGHGVGRYNGNLLKNLQAVGVGPADIDTVIITHVHPDHIGGCVNVAGKPVFPQARYIMHRKEWEFWAENPDMGDAEAAIVEEMLECVRKSLLPLRDRLELVDHEKNIRPGLELIEAPGHTPGHFVLVISSGDEQLFCVDDIFHNTWEVGRPDILVEMDLEQEQGSRVKTQILTRFRTANPLVYACHFPFPALGHILPSGDTWTWQPLEPV